MKNNLRLIIAGLRRTVAVSGKSLDLSASPLTIVQAIQLGADHFPSVRACFARVSAAQCGVELTRAAYLSRLDVGFPGSRGTFNNVSELFFLNPFTQPISGPELRRGRIRAPGAVLLARQRHGGRSILA